MSEQTKKGKLLETVTVFDARKEGKDKYINFLARIATEKNPHGFLIKESRITREQWMEVYDRLSAGALIYENPFNGGAGNIETTNEVKSEDAPF